MKALKLSAFSIHYINKINTELYSAIWVLYRPYILNLIEILNK